MVGSFIGLIFYGGWAVFFFLSFSFFRVSFFDLWILELCFLFSGCAFFVVCG